MVPVVIGLFGYANYVYIGTLCVPAINGDSVGIGRSTGIGFLIPFCLFSSMFLWTYFKVILTPPGFAADHVAKEPHPDIPTLQPSPNQTMHAQPVPNGNGNPQASKPDQNGYPSAPPVQYADIMARWQPPAHPSLAPAYRYCEKETIVKPMRAHHCRACGKCVLMFDHHCPWVGQCVGARNSKFFLHFLQWCPIFTLYTFITLVIAVVSRHRTNRGDLDPQQIVILGLTALFSLFTIPLLATQMHMAFTNSTTVEQYTHQRVRDQRKAVLEMAFPLCRRRGYRNRLEVRRLWDAEWGQVGTEGNVWWLGSFRANWEARMGKNPWGWFLPIGKSRSDGLEYPVNPRFDDLGRWRRRHDWPPELQ